MLSDVIEMTAGALKGWLLRRLQDDEKEPEQLNLKLVTHKGKFLCTVTLKEVDKFD
jgi:hypothetical protein